MSNSDISGFLASVFRTLAEEMETNKRLASKMTALWQEKPVGGGASAEARPAIRKKATTAGPPAIDPFTIFLEGGSVKLYAALEQLDPTECKAVLTYYALDPSRSYSRLRNKDKLATLIVQRVKAVTSKGEVFND